MPDLIIALSDGRTTHTCGETCYNATTPKCKCMCEGVNHGVGFTRAQANSLIHARELTRNVIDLHPDTEHLVFHYYQ